jgi:hypothetical protein
MNIQDKTKNATTPAESLIESFARLRKLFHQKPHNDGGDHAYVLRDIGVQAKAKGDVPRCCKQILNGLGFENDGQVVKGNWFLANMAYKLFHSVEDERLEAMCGGWKEAMLSTEDLPHENYTNFPMTVKQTALEVCKGLLNLDTVSFSIGYTWRVQHDN